MSMIILNVILSEMQVWLNENEREQLYHELTAYFGLISATNECQALENAWLKRRHKRLERIEGVV